MRKTGVEMSEGEARSDEVNREPPSVSGRIGTGALSLLGRPPNLIEVAVRALWDHCYRINVLTDPDESNLVVAHSHFVHASQEGGILSSTPPMTRLYP